MGGRPASGLCGLGKRRVNPRRQNSAYPSLERFHPGAYERDRDGVVANPPRPDFRIFLRAASLLTPRSTSTWFLRELLDGLDRLLRPTHWSLLLRDEANR